VLELGNEGADVSDEGVADHTRGKQNNIRDARSAGSAVPTKNWFAPAGNQFDLAGSGRQIARAR